MQADGTKSSGSTQNEQSLRIWATEIVQTLQSAGFEAFWVGGCVRDFLLGHSPKDFDIATSAVPDEVERLFDRTIPVGKKFGVEIVLRNGAQFQVATFRAESDYQDGRHPGHVTFGDPQADAKRRDFTVNGLFYDPLKKELRDWVEGEKDLHRRIIRTIGSARERFAEDHLRLLRAVRLAAQLDFRVEEETMTCIQELAPNIRQISGERIRDELLKLFRPPHAGTGLDLLRESGLLVQILPEIAAAVDCEQSPEFHPEGSVFNHIKLMCELMPEDADPLLPWAVLLHDVGKPVTRTKDQSTGAIHFYEHERVGEEMARAILERLRFPRKQIDDVCKAVRCHMQFKDVMLMRKATLRRLLLRPTFPLELQLHRLDCLGSHGNLEVFHYLIDQKNELEKKPQIRPPLLKGDDLLAMGMKAGPEMGALLSRIRDMQLQEELTTGEQAREWVKRELSHGGPQKLPAGEP
jgi:poly(A) polymerase